MSAFDTFPRLAPLPTYTADADTGGTAHFMSFSVSAALYDIQLVSATKPVSVVLPDGRLATLNLPSSPTSARHVHLFPDWICSLHSIGLLCDCGFTVAYTATTVTIMNAQGIPVLHSLPSASTNNIWLIDISGPTHSPSAAAVIAEATGIKRQIAMGSCALSTLECALSYSYVSLPGLDGSMLRKYGSTSAATSKGHLDRSRQGMRSTKLPD